METTQNLRSVVTSLIGETDATPLTVFVDLTNGLSDATVAVQTAPDAELGTIPAEHGLNLEGHDTAWIEEQVRLGIVDSDRGTPVRVRDSDQLIAPFRVLR